MEPYAELIVAISAGIVGIVVPAAVPYLRTVAKLLHKIAGAAQEQATNGKGTAPERVVDLEAEIKGLRTRMADTEELVEARYRKLLARDRRASKEREEEEEELASEEEAQLALEALRELPVPPDPRRRLMKPRRGRRPF